MSHDVIGSPELSRLRHHVPAIVAAAVAAALLLLLPEPGSDLGVVIAVAVLQLALVVSWSAALGFRGRIGAGLIGLGAAAAADVLVLDSSSDGLGSLAAVLGLAFVLSFVHQLARRPPRREVTDSLAGVALLTVTVVALSAYLVLFQTVDGPVLLGSCVAAVGAAVVVGHLVDLALPYPRIVEGVPRGLLGFVVGTAAAVVVAVYAGGATDLVERLGAIILGGILGGVACLTAIAASFAAAERRGRSVAQAVVQAVLPFAATAPIAYFVSVLVGG